MRRCGSRPFESRSSTSEAAAADVTDTLTLLGPAMVAVEFHEGIPLIQLLAELQ